MYASTYLATLALAALVAAKTDLAGCTSSKTVVYGGASMVYWVPGTGEICSFLDCGGGRAPPKTTVPGCPQYSGTASYTPDYLPGYGAVGATPTAASSSVAASSAAVQTSARASASPSASASGASTLATITSAPVVSSAVSSGVASGTGSLSSAAQSGKNNVTGTATLSTGPSAPQNTGAANMLSVGGGAVGVVVGMMGLGLL